MRSVSKVSSAQHQASLVEEQLRHFAGAPDVLLRHDLAWNSHEKKVITSVRRLSNTITMPTAMNPETLQQMAGMMGAVVSGAKAQGGSVKAKGPTSSDDIVTKVKARKMAAKMGEGVRFVSRTPIKTRTAEGAKVVFAFDDINKVAVNETASPGGK
jgi:hypothetical protein